MLFARERRLLALVLAPLVLFLIIIGFSGLVPAAQFFPLLSAYLEMSFALWLVLGLGAAILLVIQQARRGREGSAFLQMVRLARTRWKEDYFLAALLPPIFFALLMASFNAFKQFILVKAAFRFDHSFAALDRMLFFGEDPWRVTHAIFASPEATLAIDRLYHGWFLPMSIGVMICAWMPLKNWHLRGQYLFTYLGVWVLQGSLIAFLLPAAGPCFMTALVDPQSGFGALDALLRDQQTALQGPVLVSLSNQQMLLNAHGDPTLVVGGGISAMPSVHSALAILFALAAFRINRWAGALMAVYALAIWIGSIHLGWHYAIDGIAALVLTWGTWVAAGKCMDWAGITRSDPILRPVKQPV